MLGLTGRIPEQYLGEYREKQTVFIRNRVHLFCILSIAFYFFVTIADVLINPTDFMMTEIMIGLVLIFAGVLLLFFNSRAKTFFAIKLSAYIFIVLLLALLTEVGVDYADSKVVDASNVLLSSSVFVFVLFLVLMTIPWSPSEVVPIWIMHVVAFTTEFLLARGVPHVPKEMFGLKHYLEGFIFLAMAFALCLIVRRREAIRDIANFLLLKEVENKNEQIHKELEWAVRVHKSIIPHSISNDRVEIAVKYLPASYIGGDYAKFEFPDDDRLIFIISDVTGHGVPAALLVNRFHAEFERLAKKGKEPGSLLKELNEFIKEEFEGSDMYLTAFCGLLDFKKMHLLYSSYGHPPQYLYSEKENNVKNMPAHTSLLGLPVNDSKTYQSDIEVHAGDKILLYTDGVTETVNSRNEEYGNDRLEKFLKKNHNLSAEDFNRKLLGELDVFKDGKFKDDVCMLTIGIKHQRSIFEIGGQIFGGRKK